jgi:dCMP deaminase
MIISDGFNGTPSGFDNCCEDEEGKTLWYVLHAEANAITKVAKSTHNAKGATLYITLSPCKECSKLVHQAGIKRVVYINQYKDDSGLHFLREAGVEVQQIKDINE